MCRVTLNPRSTPVFHGDQNAAGIRTIVRTGGVHNLLHGHTIIRPKIKRAAIGAARWNSDALTYCAVCASRTRCAHSTGSPLTESFRTNPRATTGTETVALAVCRSLRVSVLLLPWKKTVPAPVFTVKGPPSERPSRPVFSSLEVARIAAGHRHAARDDKPVHALASQ